MIGSLIFSLILAVSLSCIRRYHPSRRQSVNNHVAHSDMEQTHFMVYERFQPPPSYEEIGTSSLPPVDNIQAPQYSEEIISDGPNLRNFNEDDYAMASVEESHGLRRKSLDSDILQLDSKSDEDNRSNFNDEFVDISDMLPIL